MTRYFLGKHLGATKTDALITDETGRALGFGRPGPGSRQAVTYAGMASALHEATTKALSMAELTIEQINAGGFGIGGYDWPSQRPQMLKTIRETIGISAPIEICNDAVLGLWAGTDDGWGIALVAGTSNNCRGR